MNVKRWSPLKELKNAMFMKKSYKTLYKLITINNLG